MRRRLTSFAWTLAPAIALITVWSILVPEGGRTAFLLGRPNEIVDASRRLVQTPAYWSDLWASTIVLWQGYIMGVIGGFGTGLAIWYSGRYGRIASLYLVALGSIPLFSLAPILIFAFGIGEGTRVLIVTLSVWIPMALAASFAAIDVESKYYDLLQSLHGSRAQSLSRIIGPGTFFMCLPSLKPAANAALVAVFLSEWISAEQGLAKFVLASMSIYNVPAMWVGLLTFVVMGTALALCVDLVHAKLTHWNAS